MFLQELWLQQFRCFQDKKLSFSKHITVITGENGTGKTSIIEAIYYLSYFKSFRSHVISELMQSGNAENSFFLKGEFCIQKDQKHVIQVGYSQRKKSIKFDQKSVISYKQVLSLFQVVTLTEDDIDLIRGCPANRRAFIDQAVLLQDPEFLEIYKEFRKILKQRNIFLERYYQGFDKLEFEIWTQKLWLISVKIQKKRQILMKQIETIVNELIEQYFDGIYTITMEYEAKINEVEEFGIFMNQQLTLLLPQEIGWKRSLFGAHLDDLVFQIRGNKARIFASRGQQKLISLLSKLALTRIGRSDQVKPLLLIDDFISDFDKIRLKNLIRFFSDCNNQIIITAPFYDVELKKLLESVDPDVINITA